MTNFKDYFQQTDKEYQREVIATQAGYHSENAAYQPNLILFKQDMSSLDLSNAPFMTTPADFTAAVAIALAATSQKTSPVSTFMTIEFTAAVVTTIAADSAENNNNRNRNRNRNLNRNCNPPRK